MLNRPVLLNHWYTEVFFPHSIINWGNRTSYVVESVEKNVVCYFNSYCEDKVTPVRNYLPRREFNFYFREL